MRHHAHAIGTKSGIPAGVIAVVMRVDQIAHRLLGDGRDRCLDLVVQRRELSVHHDHAVGGHRNGDVAALAFQHVSLVAEIGGLDLDLGEILFGHGGCGCCGSRRGGSGRRRSIRRRRRRGCRLRERHAGERGHGRHAQQTGNSLR
jgi:hypothetical protein